MAEQIVKLLKFPGSEDTYSINATQLDGHTWNDVTDAIADIASFDALRYMGTVAAGTTAPGGFTPAADKGDVYKITSKGYVMGAKVEIGDMLICNTDDTVEANSSNYTAVAANWDLIQGNIDIDALMAHTHDITVTLSKSAKTLQHTITPTEADLTASFTGGAASVNGAHGHTASGAVEVTPEGSIADTSITPEGSVKLTAPATAGTNDVTLTPSGTVGSSATEFVTSVSIDAHGAHGHTGSTSANTVTGVTGSVTISTGTGAANYTPNGTIGDATVVTGVECGSNTISAHSASSENAGGFTPAGSVTGSVTAQGSVASHKHSVALNPTSDNRVTGVSVSYASETQTLTLSAPTASTLTSVTVSEDSVAPAFTGSSASIDATFTGTAVADHKHTVTVGNHDAITPNVTATTGAHTHTFTGTGAELKATHSLTATAHTHGVTIDDCAALAHTYTAPTATHAHTFTGNAMNVHAAFTGTAASHKHTFTGTKITPAVSVTVNGFTGNFTGTASGTVTPSLSKVLTGVAIAEHSVTTADSASATTSEGKQN